MNPESLLLTIVGKIKEYHSANAEDPIPTSDIMLRKVLGGMGLTRGELDNYLQLLVDAHYLFILRIVEADEAVGESELNGYVYADLSLVNDMGRFYDKKLESLYEYEKYRRKDALSIIKELVPQIRIYKHTAMGKVLNVGVMLKQYQHVMGENYWRYKDNKRSAFLLEVIQENSHLFQTNSEDGEAGAPEEVSSGETETGLDKKPLPEAELSSGEVSNLESAPEIAAPEKKAEQEDSHEEISDINAANAAPTLPLPPLLSEAEGEVTGERHTPAPWKGEPAAQIQAHESANTTQGCERALDTDEYKRLQQMNLAGKWGAAVSAYGVQFLLRVHLRKYEFHVIRRLIVVRGVAREEDLAYIKTSVETMMRNIDKDPGLRNHIDEMQELYNLTLQRLSNLERAREKAVV